MTVGKTWVSDTLSRHCHELACLQRDIRSRPPSQVPVNDTWAMDWTFIADKTGRQQTLLGILDHGSRRCLTLTRVANKGAWTLLGHLCLTIGKYGRPRAIRTDNESMFTGRVFATFLRLLRIRHQRTAPGCPWMNGRIERFFGTLKPVLRLLVILNGEFLQETLRTFALFYNQVRPHQNLNGCTPIEAWEKIDISIVPRRPGEVFRVSALGGILNGFYLRR